MRSPLNATIIKGPSTCVYHGLAVENDVSGATVNMLNSA